jgi:hypothetical protein
MSAHHDERRCALVHAETGTEAWRNAARHQLHAPADHADFYTLTGEAVTTLNALDDLFRILAEQVAGYPVGRRLYDDTGETDPTDRLRHAVAELHAAGDALHDAQRAANAFWSAIGHIGVEARP